MKDGRFAQEMRLSMRAHCKVKRRYFSRSCTDIYAGKNRDTSDDEDDSDDDSEAFRKVSDGGGGGQLTLMMFPDLRHSARV